MSWLDNLLALAALSAVAFAILLIPAVTLVALPDSEMGGESRFSRAMMFVKIWLAMVACFALCIILAEIEMTYFTTGTLQ